MLGKCIEPLGRYGGKVHYPQNGFKIDILTMLAFSPIVVAAAGNLKQTAHGFNGIFPTESFDNTLLQFHLLPASNRKYRSSSTCIRKSLSSSLRFLFLGGRSLAWSTLGARYICVCDQSRLSALPFCQSFNLLLCAGTSSLNAFILYIVWA